jgi:hypothetical protein
MQGGNLMQSLRKGLLDKYSDLKAIVVKTSFKRLGINEKFMSRIVEQKDKAEARIVLEMVREKRE